MRGAAARRVRDLPRRRAAGIPASLQFATKPQLAMRQLDRLTAAGLPAGWVAFDEVYGRSEELRLLRSRHAHLPGLRGTGGRGMPDGRGPTARFVHPRPAGQQRLALAVHGVSCAPGS
jgi:hypothetical protein